jgi:chemotaxis protein methyltransferase CheR
MTDNETPKQAISNPYTMSDAELKKFVDLVYKECGIALTSAKKSMLSARLAKRLRALGIESYKEYYNFLTETLGKNDEIFNMVDVVTTNTTHFFRESNHFDYLTKHAVPRLLEPGRPLRIWSAGCSSGQEPYTIAMVLADYFETNEGDFEIVATDISTKVLKIAKQGIYDSEAIENIPVGPKLRYMMRGKGAQLGKWRVIPDLRQKIQFGKLNFMDYDYGIAEPFDIIFCRNVIIYFDRDTKINLISRFHEHLVPGGYLFIGHSETLNGINADLRPVAPTVYRKPENTEPMSRRLAA